METREFASPFFSLIPRYEMEIFTENRRVCCATGKGVVSPSYVPLNHSYQVRRRPIT